MGRGKANGRVYRLRRWCVVTVPDRAGTFSWTSHSNWPSGDVDGADFESDAVQSGLCDELTGRSDRGPVSPRRSVTGTGRMEARLDPRVGQRRGGEVLRRADVPLDPVEALGLGPPLLAEGDYLLMRPAHEIPPHHQRLVERLAPRSITTRAGSLPGVPNTSRSTPVATKPSSARVSSSP